MTTFSKTRYTSQAMQNWGFDDTFKVPTVEILGYNSEQESLNRVKVNSSGELTSSLESLVDTLQELVQRLAPLAGAMNNTAQLRVVATGAVTATGGGYITSAQEVAALLTQTTSLINYYRRVSDNTLVTMANINNAVAA